MRELIKGNSIDEVKKSADSAIRRMAKMSGKTIYIASPPGVLTSYKDDVDVGSDFISAILPIDGTIRSAYALVEDDAVDEVSFNVYFNLGTMRSEKLITIKLEKGIIEVPLDKEFSAGQQIVCRLVTARGKDRNLIITSVKRITVGFSYDIKRKDMKAEVRKLEAAYIEEQE